LTGETVKLAFRIGYLGNGFHGSQIQPDVKTVQGELVRVFQSLKWIDENNTEHNLVLSSRTDAGVNVRVNGGAVTIKKVLWDSLGAKKMIRAIDDRLCEGISFLDVIQVADDWNPRLAQFRVYRYRIEGIEFWKYPGDVFTEYCNLFTGTYDASNFARVEEGKEPMRTILSCTPWIVNNRVVGFEIVGLAFLWNQVRRTANAIFKMSIGDLTIEQVKQAIEKPELTVDFGVAPPEWLILWGVSWQQLPLPDSNTEPYFTSVPEGRVAERTMRKRWRLAAEHEMKSLLYNEWAAIGELPITHHRNS
jgi:tRNA pseudouridine38-40 synthase